jgi:formylmethanofuran dehydrogenase subunit E
LNKKIVEIATELHGHLAPGIALGLRMSELALMRLKANRGDKYLVAVSETARCLADAMQAATGCTMGHGNAFIEDYGKLALTIGDARTKNGVRIALKDDVNNHSSLMNKWMMRRGKLSHEEEDILSNQLLNLDEIYFLIHNVELSKSQNFERSSIVNCSKCGELIPHSLTVIRSGMIYCRGCGSGSYYKPGEDKIKVNPLDPL